MAHLHVNSQPVDTANPVPVEVVSGGGGGGTSDVNIAGQNSDVNVNITNASVATSTTIVNPAAIDVQLAGQDAAIDVNIASQDIEVVTRAGIRDPLNSSAAALGAAATFTGPWVQNDDAQIAFNALADQDGELFVEFSIDGTASTITLSKRYEVYANQGEFDALVKMPGRFHRIRYVNGSVAQSSFALLCSTAPSGLFPYALSDRNSPKFATANVSGINATEWHMLVDLSDRAQFPHNHVGRVDLHSVFIFVDKGGQTNGAVQLGVVLRVDGTDAKVGFVQGVSFDNSSERTFSRDRVFNTPILCGQASEMLTQVATSFIEDGITAVNTATPLVSPFGTATPQVGDLLVRFQYTSGQNYTAAVSAQYSTSPSST